MMAKIFWRLRIWIDTARSVVGPPGHWEWRHEFKTCPSGERHCPHTYWVRDNKSPKLG